MAGKPQNQKQNGLRFVGYFERIVPIYTLDFFKTYIAHEICKQFCARKQSILNDISKTKFKEQKFYERRMQTVP